MRDFLNTSNGSSRPGNITNGSVDLESPPTPLGGRTVSALAVICINYHVSGVLQISYASIGSWSLEYSALNSISSIHISLLGSHCISLVVGSLVTGYEAP